VKLVTPLLSSMLVLVGCGGASATHVTGGTTGGTGGAKTTGSTTSAGGATTTSSTTSTGGATPDGGHDFCSMFCATTFLCGTQAKCVLADPAAAASACTAACQGASNALTMAQATTLAACYACLNGQTPAICPAASLGSCKQVCDDPSVNQAGDAFVQAVQNEPGTAALTCTDGENLVVGHCFETSSTSSCTLGCCKTETTCTTPDVEAECTVPDAGAIPCTCMAGKNKGKTFQVPNAPDFCGDLNVWYECNL
jgi:hypothetical protein